MMLEYLVAGSFSLISVLACELLEKNCLLQKILTVIVTSGYLVIPSWC